MEELEQPDLLSMTDIIEEIQESDKTNQSEGSNEKYGKFKDADSLLKAYSNLEAEFTKKSQRLKALESATNEAQEKENARALIERQVNEFVTKFDFARPFSETLKKTLTTNNETTLEQEMLKLLSNDYKSADDYIKDEGFLNKYVFDNKTIKEKIIKDYLSRVTLNTPIKIETGSSNIPLTGPKVPSTISEAGRLAKSMIKQK